MLVIERIAKHPLRAWTVVILSAVAAAWLAGAGYRGKLEQDRLALLNIDVQRDAIAAMSLTLDSNLMGAISLLGLIEPDIKNESAEAIRSSQPKISALLESIARSQQIQGLFVVGKDGFVKSSWDDSGKPSTGIDVRFRPYYQQAMAGRNNIYAAVSLARGDHALYFAAPVYAAMARSGDPVGVVVARTDMEKLERLLARSGQAAMLLSPQGVVFASSRHEWRGMLAGPVTPARVAEIRAVRQFGKLFEEQEPRPLPVSIAPGLVQGEGRQYAVASAAVDWHDPPAPGNWWCWKTWARACRRVAACRPPPWLRPWWSCWGRHYCAPCAARRPSSASTANSNAWRKNRPCAPNARCSWPRWRCRCSRRPSAMPA